MGKQIKKKGLDDDRFAVYQIKQNKKHPDKSWKRGKQLYFGFYLGKNDEAKKLLTTI